MDTASAAPQPRGFRLFTYENGLLLLLGLTFGVAFFDRQAINLVMPFLAPDLGLTNTQIGALNSGLSLAWAVAAYVVGAWSDRLGVRKPFLIAAVIIFSLCSIFSGLATGFVFLLMARIVMGAAEGPFLPICLSVMNSASSENRRGLNAGVMQNAFGALLAVTIAPPLLAWLATDYSWRVAFFVAGVPGLLLLPLLLRFVREPKPEPRAPAGERASASPLALLRIRNIALCGAIGACLAGWGLLIPPFLPLFYEQFRGMSPQTAVSMLSVLGISTAIFGFLAPGLSDRIGRRPVMVAASAISMLLPLGALYYQGPLAGLAVIMFVGWVGTGVFPLFMGIIPAESASRALAATAMGLIVGVSEILGGVLIPMIGGSLADAFDLRATLYLSAGLAAAAAVLSLFLEETAPLKLARTGAASPQAIGGV